MNCAIENTDEVTMHFKYINLQAFCLIFVSVISSAVWAQNTNCISHYTPDLNPSSVNLMERLNAEFRTNLNSHPMMITYSWMDKEFNSLSSNYNDFLISLKKVGIDNKLQANLQIANALYHQASEKIQEINTELDKKERSPKKVATLSEALKQCSLKVDTCMNNLKEAVSDSLNQIEKIKEISKGVSDASLALENMKMQLNQQSLDIETKEMILNAVQSQINKFNSYAALTENFKNQLNRSLTSALFYIHDTYPQLMLELKIADAKGADLDLLIEKTDKKNSKSQIPQEILQEKLSAKAKQVIEAINFSQVDLLKSTLLNSITSDDTDLFAQGSWIRLHKSYKFVVNDLVKIFDAYLEKSTDLNIKLERGIVTFDAKYDNFHPFISSLTSLKSRFSSRNSLVVPSFLLLLSSNELKTTIALTKHFNQRMLEMQDSLEQELKESKSSDGFFYFMNSEKRQNQALLKQKLGDLKLAIKSFNEEAALIQNDLSLFNSKIYPAIRANDILIRIHKEENSNGN